MRFLERLQRSIQVVQQRAPRGRLRFAVLRDRAQELAQAAACAALVARASAQRLRGGSIAARRELALQIVEDLLLELVDGQAARGERRKQ